MNKTFAAILSLLAILNTCGVAYLVVDRLSESRSPDTRRALTDAELEQLSKLFKLALQFRTELEQLAGRAEYPSEKEKSAANNYLQNHLLTLKFAEMELERTRRERSQQAAKAFVATCWGDQGFFAPGTSLMDVQKYTFGKYNNAIEDYVPFPGVNFSRLEALNNEFRVMALSFVKDLSGG